MRLILALATGLAATLCAQQTLHVAGDAATAGDGTRRAPCQTLEQARDRLRSLRQSGALAADEAVTILVEPGCYRLTRTFELTAADGGTPQAPVVWRARRPGSVRLQGGPTLDPASFTVVADPATLARLDPAARAAIRVCDLSDQLPDPIAPLKPAYQGAPKGPWLHIDGQPMTLARWPNAGAGWGTFTRTIDKGLPQPEATDPALRAAHPGSFVFDDPRPARWRLDEGVWLHGYWTHDWSDEVIRIAAYDPQTRVVTLAAPHGYGLNAGTWGRAERRFYALNLLEELDEPGEWYLDRAAKKLYVYPRKPLAGAAIVLAMLEQPLVKITGAADLTLTGFAFEYGHGDGLVLRETARVEIAGCTVANCAGSGITVVGRDTVIRSCDLFNLGRTGISLDGGDRRTLTPARNLAENNHVHHYGRFQRTYAPGIGAHGCGQVVRRNRIHDAPHNGVLYGGNNHLFELNEVYRVVMETGDAGAFYTGRDWASQGNILRHNYIHHLGAGDGKHVNTMGVYLDDCDCGDTLVGNIFFRAGRAIMIGGGRDNPVLDNLVVDCPVGLHIDNRGTTWKQWNNPADPSWCLEKKAQAFAYTEPPWSLAYPRLAAILAEEPRQPLNNPIRRNLFVDCAKLLDGEAAIFDRQAISDNRVVDTTGTNTQHKTARTGFTVVAGTPDHPVDLGFADPQGGDFSPRRGARPTQALPFFEPIPFDRIGIYADAWRRRLPPRD